MGALAGVLFGLYLVAYAGFVVAAAFLTFKGGSAVGGLAVRTVGGVPWGVLAGLGLIVGAFVLALAYALLGPVERDAEQGERR
jgi:uncharacterized membrane protein (DUF485 family)